MHCHNLTHEDHDMMTQFQVGDDGPAWNSDPAKPISQAGPLVPPKTPGPRPKPAPKPVAERPRRRRGRRRRRK
jgi:spore coat protein A, manganese oxidase